MLDAAIAVLPSDALALLLIMDLDMYEDDDDEFGCGCAYGYSHVCLVSKFRYNPALDKSIKLDRQYAWPASHCAEYVQAQIDRFIEASERTPGSEAATPAQPSKPLTKAIRAHSTANPSSVSMWLERVCRTASQELGHCLGMDNCMYYACIMQRSNSMPEDLRQPPYLCPVDNAKLEFLVAARGDKTQAGVRKREGALLHFVIGHGENGGGFAAFRAWLEARLAHGDTQIPSYTEKQISEKMAPAKKQRKSEDNTLKGLRRSKRVTSRDLNVRSLAGLLS